MPTPSPHAPADELEPAQLEALRDALETLARELREALGTLDEAARPVDLDEPIGRVSRIDAIAQQNMARANRAAAERRLAQVDAALARLAEGEYGACRACEEPIGYRRLCARPEALLCIACQSRGEA